MEYSEARNYLLESTSYFNNDLPQYINLSICLEKANLLLNQPNISIESGLKTFEFELSKANVSQHKGDILNNFFFKYLENTNKDNIYQIKLYLETLSDDLNNEEQFNVALLLWKSMPSKAEFAQDFAICINDNLEDARKTLVIPTYIKNALNFIKS